MFYYVFASRHFQPGHIRLPNSELKFNVAYQQIIYNNFYAHDEREDTVEPSYPPRIAGVMKECISGWWKIEAALWECLWTVRWCYTGCRYGIHLWDVNHDGVWENRAIYVYYSELLFEISALSVDLCHHLHMLVSSFQSCRAIICL